MRGFCILIVICLVVALAGCSINTSPGSGEKIGQIVKLSKQGMLVDTWEAQLIRGGLSGGNGAFGVQPFDFTIEDDQMAAQAQKYMQEQTEVIIKYRMEGFYSLFRTESGGHFLVSISPAPKDSTKK